MPSGHKSPRPIGLVRCAILVVLGLAAAGSTGCGPRRPKMAPVKGRVLFQDQPLTFGSVMFQPEGGQPARGEIQPDGSFVLSTYGKRDGAAVGKHRVRVTCFEGQKEPIAAPADLERPLGKSLIPRKYTNIDTSGIEIEVPPSSDPLVIRLEGE